MNDSSIDRLLSPSNPFATHHVRAGMIPYRFDTVDEGENFFVLIGNNPWMGQIVGPHGTGKSTLLKTLEPFFVDVGRVPISFSLHNGQSRMPIIDWRAVGPDSQLIVDGYEQLRVSQRLWLQLRCKAAGCGLLVTTHRGVCGLPVIHRTSATRSLVRSLVAELVDEPLEEQVIDSCFEQAAGNVRETFMLLYDAYATVARPLDKSPALQAVRSSS